MPESEKVDHLWEPIPDPTRSLLKAASERWINADEATQALWERAEVEQRQLNKAANDTRIGPPPYLPSLSDCS